MYLLFCYKQINTRFCVVQGTSHICFSIRSVSNLRFDHQESRDTTFKEVRGRERNENLHGDFAGLGKNGKNLCPAIRAAELLLFPEFLFGCGVVDKLQEFLLYVTSKIIHPQCIGKDCRQVSAVHSRFHQYHENSV